MIKKNQSESWEQLNLGSLLGDASCKIYKPYKNARIVFKHGVKQEVYFFWKVNLLNQAFLKPCHQK